MGLPGDGAIGHRAGPEALDDLLDRLDFLQRHGPAHLIPEVQHGADGARAVVLHQGGVFVELRPVVRPHRLLEGVDDPRAVQVFLGLRARAQLVPADACQTVLNRIS